MTTTHVLINNQVNVKNLQTNWKLKNWYEERHFIRQPKDWYHGELAICIIKQYGVCTRKLVVNYLRYNNVSSSIIVVSCIYNTS